MRLLLMPSFSSTVTTALLPVLVHTSPTSSLTSTTRKFPMTRTLTFTPSPSSLRSTSLPVPSTSHVSIPLSLTLPLVLLVHPFVPVSTPPTTTSSVSCPVWEVSPTLTKRCYRV